MSFRLGDYVVRRDGSETTLYSVDRAAGFAPRPSNGHGEARLVWLNYVEDGRPHTRTDAQEDQYRHATEEEVAAAEKEGRMPPG